MSPGGARGGGANIFPLLDSPPLPRSLTFFNRKLGRCEVQTHVVGPSVPCIPIPFATFQNLSFNFHHFFPYIDDICHNDW